jgi:cytochrome P450
MTMALADRTTLPVPDRRRPAAPVPPPRQLSMLHAFRAARDNPLTLFSQQAYELPIVHAPRLLVVSDPASIERVMVDNVANYPKSRLQQRRVQPALGDGLFTAEGELWRAERRTAAPLFAPRAIAALQADMATAAEATAARWATERPAGGVLDLADAFQRLTYEIVSQSVFSGALDADRAIVHAMMARYFDTIGRIDLATYFDLPRWLPTLAMLRARPAVAGLRRTVARVVGERRTRRDAEDGAPDLLDRLLAARDPQTGAALTPEIVGDNVLTFLAAGHETTANALTWASYLIAAFPWAEERLLAELEAVCGSRTPTPAELDRLVFTRAFVEETLRLYPPAAFLARQAVAADRLGAVDVAPGTQILVSPWIVHRHRALWDEPDLFAPDRFMPERRHAIPRGAYIPFGLGPRICIGAGFAMQEILTVLAVLVPRYRFELAHGTPEPHTRLTLSPRGGLKMRVLPRG